MFFRTATARGKAEQADYAAVCANEDSTEVDNNDADRDDNDDGNVDDNDGGNDDVDGDKDDDDCGDSGDSGILGHHLRQFLPQLLTELAQVLVKEYN